MTSDRSIETKTVARTIAADSVTGPATAESVTDSVSDLVMESAPAIRRRSRRAARAAAGSVKTTRITPPRPVAQLSRRQEAGSRLRRDATDSVPRRISAPKAPTRIPSPLIAGARPAGLVPQSLDEVLQLARIIVASGLTPRGFDTAEACVVAILHGLEVGLAPLSALQRIAILNGRPTIWGDGALALVKASGLAVLIDERIDGDGPEDWCAVCRVQRRGDPHPIERRFSVADARRAGLWGQSGPWQSYPQRMLQMRARAFALRDAFPDVLGGLYLREEVEGVSVVSHCDSQVGSPSPHPAVDGIRVEPVNGIRAESGPSPTLPPRAPRTVTTSAGSAPERPRVPFRKAPSPTEMAALAGSSNSQPDDDRSTDHGAPGRGAPDQTRQEEAPVAQSILRSPSPSPASRPASDTIASDVTPAGASLLRRTLSRDARLAERLRREAGWSIPRPRALARRRVTASVTVGRNRARSPLAEPPAVPDARHAATTAALTPVPLGEDTLSLLDDALACARDQATLVEIEEEFAARLAAIPREQHQVAQRILARHRERVRALAPPTHTKGGPGHD